MKIQPRYSLLALLVFTAVVALGVKLWYGPHHVIERPSPNLEDEYTYTRDWSGSKIVQGLRFLRYHHADGTLDHVVIEYYRQGMSLKQDYELTALPPNQSDSTIQLRAAPIPFTESEKIEFEQAVEQEAEAIRKLGLLPRYPSYMNL